jgi:hypothetical protein
MEKQFYHFTAFLFLFLFLSPFLCEREVNLKTTEAKRLAKLQDDFKVFFRSFLFYYFLQQELDQNLGVVSERLRHEYNHPGFNTESANAAQKASEKMKNIQKVCLFFFLVLFYILIFNNFLFQGCFSPCREHNSKDNVRWREHCIEPCTLQAQIPKKSCNENVLG